MSDWTFFSNYGHVLVCLAQNREVRLRDVALEVGVTERAVQKIVRDLQIEGFLTVTKQGRCNRYRINRRKSLRHGLESHCTVGKLLTLLAHSRTAAPAPGEQMEAEPAEIGETPVQTSAPPPVQALVEETDPEKELKKEKKRAGVDTREQGSLF